MQPLAGAYVPQPTSQGTSRKRESPARSRDGQLTTIIIDRTSGSDLLVAANAGCVLIDQFRSVRPDAEPDHSGEIDLGVDVMPRVGQRPAQQLGGERDGTAGLVAGGGSALKMRIQLPGSGDEHRRTHPGGVWQERPRKVL